MIRNVACFSNILQQVPLFCKHALRFGSCMRSVQFSSVAQSCPTLCEPMNCSMPGLPVHHQLPEFTQTHVHLVGDAISSSHLILCCPLLLLPPIPPSIRVFSNEWYSEQNHKKLFNSGVVNWGCAESFQSWFGFRMDLNKSRESTWIFSFTATNLWWPAHWDGWLLWALFLSIF